MTAQTPVSVGIVVMKNTFISCLPLSWVRNRGSDVTVVEANGQSVAKFDSNHIHNVCTDINGKQMLSRPFIQPKILITYEYIRSMV